MPPKRKKAAPATRRSSRSPSAGKQATALKAHKGASASKKAEVAEVGKDDAELLSPGLREISSKKGKVAGVSSPAGKRGRAADGENKRNDDVTSPEPKKPKTGKKQVKEDVIEDKRSLSTASEQLTRTIIIEACTQCRSFKERADKVKRGLESAIPGISVEINRQKPRRGYFEIREEKTEVILSLPSMNRPFTLMKQLNMDEVVEDLIKRCE